MIEVAYNKLLLLQRVTCDLLALSTVAQNSSTYINPSRAGREGL